MNKALIAVGAVAGLVLVARRFASRRGGIDFERIMARRMGSVDFGRMIERMPDNAPPKWMFTNISAIRTNTDRILELLQAERTPAGNGQVPAATYQ